MRRRKREESPEGRSSGTPFQGSVQFSPPCLLCAASLNLHLHLSFLRLLDIVHLLLQSSPHTSPSSRTAPCLGPAASSFWTFFPFSPPHLCGLLPGQASCFVLLLVFVLNHIALRATPLARHRRAVYGVQARPLLHTHHSCHAATVVIRIFICMRTFC